MGHGCVGEDTIHNNVENDAMHMNIENDIKYGFLSYVGLYVLNLCNNNFHLCGKRKSCTNTSKPCCPLALLTTYQPKMRAYMCFKIKRHSNDDLS